MPKTARLPAIWTALIFVALIGVGCSSGDERLVLSCPAKGTEGQTPFSIPVVDVTYETDGVDADCLAECEQLRDVDSTLTWLALRDERLRATQSSRNFFLR
jgi:hypothetical protein